MANGEEGNGKKNGWAALGLSSGNVVTILVALGSVFAAYVVDRETIAVLKAENVYLKEQIGNTALRVSTLEMRYDAADQRLREKIDELRDLIVQHDVGEARRLRNGTRAP